VPDRPTARAAEREPLPFSPSAPGCAYSVHVHAGQWGTCEGRPSVTGVWTSPRDRERWRAFACAAHADRFDGPEWHDVGPLHDVAAAELADRRARWADALTGKGWRPPRPMEPERPARRP
jgi:hypothetical protein